MTEQEGTVDQRQRFGETLDATTQRSSHQTLKTGPLKSEAQGLDLSVNIVWSECRGLSSVFSSLLPGHHATLLRDVIFARLRDATSMQDLTWVLQGDWCESGSAW